MRQIIKSFLLICTIVLFIRCERYTSIKILDENFLEALIQMGIDTNGDGTIGIEEAESVRYLYLTNKHIFDFTGIESFINLDSLICGNNDFTSIDLSRNTELKYLNCSDNKNLTTLDVSQNTKLKTLHANHNFLGTLDISKNTALEYLSCELNQLKALDVTNNVALKSLRCTLNGITSLDVSNNTALETLTCIYNGLETLDVSNNVSLTKLYCSSNQLPNLNISENIALIDLYCGDNQLSVLDVSNNINLKRLSIDNMPSLYKVCVWEIPFPTPSIAVYTDESPNVYYSTDCSK